MATKVFVHWLHDFVTENGRDPTYCEVWVASRKRVEEKLKTTNKPSMPCCYWGDDCDCSYPQLGIMKCSGSPCVFTATQHTLA